MTPPSITPPFTAQCSSSDKACEQLASNIVKMKAELDVLREKLNTVANTPVDLVPKQKCVCVCIVVVAFLCIFFHHHHHHHRRHRRHLCNRHAISLYAHLTNIRWDYDNENLIQGRLFNHHHHHHHHHNCLSIDFMALLLLMVISL